MMGINLLRITKHRLLAFDGKQVHVQFPFESLIPFQVDSDSMDGGEGERANHKHCVDNEDAP